MGKQAGDVCCALLTASEWPYQHQRLGVDSDVRMKAVVAVVLLAASWFVNQDGNGVGSPFRPCARRSSLKKDDSQSRSTSMPCSHVPQGGTSCVQLQIFVLAACSNADVTAVPVGTVCGYACVWDEEHRGGTDCAACLMQGLSTCCRNRGILVRVFR